MEMLVDEEKQKTSNDKTFKGDRIWEITCKEVKTFLENNNNKYPSLFSEDDQERKLAYWVKRQRISYQKDNISQSRKNYLNSINFEWNEVIDEEWNLMFNSLKEYIDKNNGEYPDIDDSNYKQLTKWISMQRRANQNNKLSKEKIEKLNSINFFWDTKEERWHLCYNLLCKYLELNNNVFPKKDSTEINASILYDWLMIQRESYRRKKLNQYQIDRLVKLGFALDMKEEIWNKKFNILKELLEKEGRYPKRSTGSQQEEKLLVWVELQRRAYNLGKMSQERIDKLNAIGFTWNAKEKNWIDRWVEFKDYLKKNNNQYPSQYSSDKECVRMATWVQLQRSALKNGKLSLTRYKMLRKIDFVFEYKNSKINKEAKEFFAKVDEICCCK